MNLPVTNYEASPIGTWRNFGFKIEFEVPDRKTSAIQDDAGFTIFSTSSRAHYPAQNCFSPCQGRLTSIEIQKSYNRKGVAFTNPPGNTLGYGAELRDPDGYQLLLLGRSTNESQKAARNINCTFA